ncbi:MULTISPECIES: type I restriction-modification system subunit M N-terminal domain-containing protein [unclassified Collinsella]|uniref:type I restriction-modification system subunit M N-terminal domain-containing protein n=1 Tax=unclassified Collinsella TaxID=2637548 RepID=UPI001E35867A|nr:MULTISPECIES: type I restriction-modification system subunit M N-terminal domain-containing protein [unclassified Collinsella]
MNKQRLASKIWESANKMRSKIEANEYKDYILGFIFYKFLSETEVARLKARDFAEENLPSLVEDDEETVEFVKGGCGYFIAYDNLFSTWVAKGGDFEISNVRNALSAFSRNIDPARRARTRRR